MNKSNQTDQKRGIAKAKFAGEETKGTMIHEGTKATEHQEVLSINSDEEDSYDSNEELPELEKRRSDEDISSDDESEFSDEETGEDVDMEELSEEESDDDVQVLEETKTKKTDPTIPEHPSKLFDCEKHLSKTKPWTDGMKATFRYVKTMTESEQGYLTSKLNYWHFVPADPTLRIHKIKKVKQMSKSIITGWHDPRVFEYMIQWTYENNKKIWKEFKAEGKLPDAECEEDENWKMLKETDEDNKWCYNLRANEDKRATENKSHDESSSIHEVDMEDIGEETEEVIVFQEKQYNQREEHYPMEIDEENSKYKRERSRGGKETTVCASPTKKRGENGVEAIVTPNKEPEKTKFEWAGYELDQDETEEKQRGNDEDNEGFTEVKRKGKTKKNKSSLQHIAERGGIRSVKGRQGNRGGRGRGRGYDVRSLIQPQQNSQSSIIEHFKPKTFKNGKHNKGNEEEIESDSSNEETESNAKLEPRKVHFASPKLKNPYIIKKLTKDEETTKDKHIATATQASTTQKNIPNYSDAAKGKQRAQHSNDVRLRFTYKNINGPETTFKSVLQNLLTIATSFDNEAMVMTWENEKEHGPKNLSTYRQKSYMIGNS